jgi:fibro-slime domain-containing protein
MRKWSFLPLLILSLAACSSSSTKLTAKGGDGDGHGDGDGSDAGQHPILDSGPLGDGDSNGDGDTSGDGGVSSAGELKLVIRDFRLYNANDATTNPDFENVPATPSPWPDPDIVTDTLGSDKKPVYKNVSAMTLTTHGKTAFDQWYRDVDGTNIRVDYPLLLTKGDDGTYSYDSNMSGVPYAPGSDVKMFFPIDDGTKYATTFGQEGDAHNYSFTVEAHSKFTYQGGETFSYRGDDDVFVYINSKLVINLGGIHDPEMQTVKLDDLKLTKGKSYPLDFFFAERHKGGSNVLFTTTLKLEPVVVL